MARAAFLSAILPCMRLSADSPTGIPEELALLPGCTYKEDPTGGHGLYVSHAAELNADPLEFMKS